MNTKRLFSIKTCFPREKSLLSGCVWMHTEKKLVKKWINKKKRKKKNIKSRKSKICGICFCISSCRQKIDTEKSGLRLKSIYIYIFLLCIYGNQNTSMLHCFVVQKCACVFFFNLIYFTVFSLFFFLLHH